MPKKTRIDSDDADWDIVVTPSKSSLSLKLSEMWRFKDLLVLFVKRDFVSTYKQTILGPLWFFIQPLLTTITFTIVFGNIAKLSTGGYPRLLFYLSGISVWNYFADCLGKTSTTFIANANLFSKVYFPRLLVPISVIISNLMRFGIQLVLLTCFVIYYNVNGMVHPPNIFILLTPLLILIMAGLGLGFGILISSLTTKYRDFQFLVAFSVSLMMYFSPLLFPLSTIQNATFRHVLIANPMASVIETFRYAILGNTGPFTLWMPLLYSFVFMILLLLISMVMFNRVQKTFMDSV
jgi:lipopolysaccharide transport system permease protein